MSGCRTATESKNARAQTDLPDAERRSNLAVEACVQEQPISAEEKAPASELFHAIQAALRGKFM